MKHVFFYVISLVIVTFACSSSENEYDAVGNFEGTEIIVSSENTGVIKSLIVQEGDSLRAMQKVGYIDSLQLNLKKQQLESQVKSLESRLTNVPTQIASIKQQIVTQKNERNRFFQLFQNKAATQKQIDDFDAQIKFLQKQLDAQMSSLNKSNASLLNEIDALELQISQLQDQINKSTIKSPIDGVVLSKYVESGEFVTIGKPLFKIADLKQLILRAYITSDQLYSLKLNQSVQVFADFGGDKKRSYEGQVIWIGDRSEFTPKGIQTKDERANLVYPIKIKVENDGFIRIGMYGGIRIAENE